MYYTGIGSRETPKDVLANMDHIAQILAIKNYTLRSGNAKGADSAFEKGCDLRKGKKKIWNPNGVFYPLHEWATDHASSVCYEYPLEKMKGYNIKLITRNMYQIFGDHPTDQIPSDFVVYWCKDDPIKKDNHSGGTRYAVRIAHKNNIPHFNLRTQTSEFKEYLKKLK